MFFFLNGIFFWVMGEKMRGYFLFSFFGIVLERCPAKVENKQKEPTLGFGKPCRPIRHGDSPGAGISISQKLARAPLTFLAGEG